MQTSRCTSYSPPNPSQANLFLLEDPKENNGEWAISPSLVLVIFIDKPAPHRPTTQRASSRAWWGRVLAVVVELGDISQLVVVALPNWWIALIIFGTVIPTMYSACTTRQPPSVP